MSSDSNPYLISIKDFVASKQIRLFQGLKQNCFSGQLIIEDIQKRTWIFSLYLGRIVYVRGGTHNTRRWRRNLVAHLPQIAYRLQQELNALESLSINEIEISWDYTLLSIWLEAEKISREEVTKMVRSLTTEVLFDITQTKEINYQLKQDENYLSQPLAMIDSEQQIIEAWKLWQSWQQTKLEYISPNLVPIIEQPEELKERTSAKTYQALTRLLDGKHTLRDLAIQKQKDVLLMTRSLMPYIQLKFLQLIEIPDINTPIVIDRKSDNIPIPKETEESYFSNAEIDNTHLSQFLSIERQKPVIACVDRQTSVCEAIGKIVTEAGYNFKAEQEPLRALAVLLALKPDFIFIDLLMPELNGYELCAQLRQLSSFRDTPIVIFSNNISLIDRVKAKMVGCSELVEKTLEAQPILNVITKYLDQKVVSS
ncbi:MAG: response regulator [Xenococcaceae cyanobacterium]